MTDERGTVVSRHADRVVYEQGDRFLKVFDSARACAEELRAYDRLRAAGVEGPEILEKAADRFLTERLPGRPLDELIRDSWRSMSRADRTTLVRRVAAVCRRIKDAGLRWADLVTYHLYVAEDAIRVLDPARLRKGRLDLSPLYWSTEEPTVSRTDRLRFWRAFGGGRRPPRLRRIGHRGRFRPYRWVHQRCPIRSLPPWGDFVKVVDLPYESLEEIADHKDLFIKRRVEQRVNAWLDGLHIKITDRPEEAQVEWENHRMLMAAGIRCPQPAIGGVLKDGRGLFATVHLEGQRSINELWDTLDRRQAVRALVDFARRFHACGLVHKDFYLNHFFIRPGSDELTLIDLGRVMKTRSPRLRGKDLAALVKSSRGKVTKADYLWAIRRYGVGPLMRRYVHYKARRMARHVPKYVREGIVMKEPPCTSD